MRPTLMTSALLALFLLSSAIDAQAKPPANVIRLVESPAGPASGEPNLSVTADGRLIMSWIQRGEGDQASVMMAIRDKGRWGQPRRITSGVNLFVNWADFPSVVGGSSGTLFAHWLQKDGSQPYAYGIRVSRSNDDGQSWSKPVMLHDDRTATEHGFVSMAPDQSGGVAVVWLDGRKMTPGEEKGEMTLRYARLRPDGSKVRESVLDPRTCECCQTGMTIAADGPVIVYRDRTVGEVRDIAVVRWDRNRWSQPALVAQDGWKTDGCPVNGPQIDSRGANVVVAWFTGAREKARVNVAFSKDGGRSFRPPVAVDHGSPIGRVDVVMLPSGSAQVTWLERAAGNSEVRTRTVHRDGSLTSSLTVGASSAARSSGFPRSVVIGGKLFFAWTQAGEPSRIMVSELTLGEAGR